MTKFIEVTDRGDGKKVLINVNQIFAIHEQENGLAYVEIHITDDCEMGFGVACMESYIELYNQLCT